jgi:hypothetical protein
MTAPILMDSICTSSYSREKEWQQCCTFVMGFEWVDNFDEEEEKKRKTILMTIDQKRKIIGPKTPSEFKQT